MIEISQPELEMLLGFCELKYFRRHDLLAQPGITPEAIYFINKGLVRVVITDSNGTEHSLHFAMENQFIADYSAFIRRQPALYSLVAEEETEVVVMPRAAVDWGYKHLQQGDRLGRLIAEFYFIYQDNRLKNLYARTAKERYDTITDIFPQIHRRVPQHMIASYLGITPVHLSRLKKADKQKT